MRKASRTALVAAGIALAVSAGVVGCGKAEQLSGKDTVSTALDAVGEARTATFTLSLDSTVADLQRLDTAGGADPTPAAQLQQLLDGELSVTVSAPDGSTLAETSKAQQGSSDVVALLQDPAALEKYLKTQGATALAVRLGGDALVELRAVEGTVYARADVPQLLTLAGQDPATATSFTAQLPPALQPVAKAAQGEWISVDLVAAARSLKSAGLLDQLAQMPQRQLPTTTDPAAVSRLLQSLKTAYEQQARITDLGEDGERGTGYRLTAPAKQVVQAIETDLVALAGGQAGDVRKAIAQTPDRDVSVDLWVQDDELRAVSLDLTQFAEKPVEGGKAALDIDIDLDGDEVSAPEGANALNVAEALVGLGGMFGGSMGGGAGLGATP